MKKTDFVFLAGIILAILLGGFRDFAVKAEDVQSEVLRLHIPANSDSEEDQRIKLELRDHLLERYGAELSDSGSLSEAERRTEELLPEIEADCQRFLAERGMEYGARAELAEMYFTTREYGEVTLPAGNYKALRITLGSGEGRNWWCVMFPPLCLPAVTENENGDGAEMLSDFRTDRPQKVKVKFALYELLKELLG
ncbi:MAG: stage II sporulation protein R [Oscillospiraceae bacterium]|nr:stage II sporulation protein R [Oscillospiraceae bacterium]